MLHFDSAASAIAADHIEKPAAVEHPIRCKDDTLHFAEPWGPLSE